MVHYQLRRECLTVNSIRSLDGVGNYHYNNGRSVNQESKHEIHMIINFRQVNTAICHHLQLSLNARSCICEGVRSTAGHSVATMDYLYEIIKVFRTCSTR